MTKQNSEDTNHLQLTNDNETKTNIANYEAQENNVIECNNIQNKRDYESCIFKIYSQKKGSLEPKIIKLLQNSLVDVAGEVISPGKYPIGSEVKIRDLIEFSGGFTKFANQESIEVINYSKKSTNSGMIAPGGNIFVNSFNSLNSLISLEGAINSPRKINHFPGLKLTDIINISEDFNDLVFTHFATIHRLTKETNSEMYYAFSPSKVFNNEQNFILEPGDKIKFYTKDEVSRLLKLFIKVLIQ